MTTGTAMALTLPRLSRLHSRPCWFSRRRMTRLRQDALRDPGSPHLTAEVRRGARDAAVLSAAIAALSLTPLALGTVIAT